MATMNPVTDRLTNSQLTKMLALIKGADSVELKLTVPESGRRATAEALGVDPLEAQIRQVFFFDTPSLALNKAGLVVRARRIQGKGDDSVVKLRPVVPEELPKSLRKSPNFVVEVDAMPGGFVCSASLKRTMPSPIVRNILSDGGPIRKIFSKEQRQFFADHAPRGIDLDSLSVLGPITVFKLKFAPKELANRVVAEQWVYPDGSRLVELSTKATPATALQVAAEARSYLTGLGVPIGAEQTTKTKTALEFFAKELKATRQNGARRARTTANTKSR